ncbi:MAG: P27 family phage terminase small subunit [Acidobacteriota bacterium]
MSEEERHLTLAPEAPEILDEEYSKKKKKGKPRYAPQFLAKSTREWWLRVVEEYDLEEHHRGQLTLTLDAWDEWHRHKEFLEEHGETYNDRFGAPKKRPQWEMKRDAKTAYFRCLRDLDLDIDPQPDKEGRRSPSILSNR